MEKKTKKAIISIEQHDMKDSNLDFSKYDIRSILIGNPDEDFICGICFQLALSPIECDSCQRIFCNQCAMDSKRNNKLCPYKCSIQSFKIKQLHRIVRNKYLDQKVKCPNNECEFIFPLSQLISHDSQCIYKIEECGYYGCIVKAKQIEYHRSQCIYRQITCERCEQQYQAKDEHDCVKYLKQQINEMQSILKSISKKLKLENKQDKIITIQTNSHIHNIDSDSDCKC